MAELPDGKKTRACFAFAAGANLPFVVLSKVIAVVMIKPHCCPICDKACSSDAAAVSLFPFCSDRCRKIDLMRWVDGRYAIVEDVHPEVAEFLKDDPDILVQGEGAETNEQW